MFTAMLWTVSVIQCSANSSLTSINPVRPFPKVGKKTQYDVSFTYNMREEIFGL